MAIAYQLVTYIYSFNGTDHESSRDLRIIAMSKSRETLEEIKSKILGTCDGYFYDIKGDESPYIAASHNHYKVLRWQDRPKKPMFTMQLDSGQTVDLYLYAVDDYYGSGNMEGLSIEEVNYIDPEEFV